LKVMSGTRCTAYLRVFTAVACDTRLVSSFKSQVSSSNGDGTHATAVQLET
jgi:hypothetical protein